MSPTDDSSRALCTDQIVVPYEVRLTPSTRSGSLGVYVTEPVAAGTTCVVFGGYVTPAQVFFLLPEDRQHHSIQVGDDLFLVCGEEMDDGDFINHSCDPTMGFAGEITLRARRDIEAGEELTFDYSMCDSQPYDEFECECKAANCRDKVTGDDWMLPELQQRYRGQFSTYLQRRLDEIDAAKESNASTD